MSQPVGLRVADARFWDSEDLRGEIDRVFDVCQSCRLCFKFCDSFPRLFEYLDDGERPASALREAEIDEVVDLCFQCRLCLPACPYAPPHDWGVDFPRLVLRSRAHRGRREPLPWYKRQMQNPARLGRLQALAPRLSNYLLRAPAFRRFLERLARVDRRKLLPPVAAESFGRWWRRIGKRAGAVAATPGGGQEAAAAEASPERRVVLFSSCPVDWHRPEIGRAALDVLRHNGYEVERPGPQICCGMPRLDGGDVDAAAETARQTVELLHPWVKRGYRVVIPSPSCSLMLREEAPQLLGDGAAAEVAAATFDLCDFLFREAREERVHKEFRRRAGPIRYHIPCHIREQQIGFRGRDILRWVSEGVEAIQECSGHDGTWSMDVAHFDDSLRHGRKAAEAMSSGEPCSARCSDCVLASLHLRQMADVEVLHPVVVLAWAYGYDVGDAASAIAESHRVQT